MRTSSEQRSDVIELGLADSREVHAKLNDIALMRTSSEQRSDVIELGLADSREVHALGQELA